MAEKVIVLCDDYKEATYNFNTFVGFLEIFESLYVEFNPYILEVCIFDIVEQVCLKEKIKYYFMDSHYVPSLDIEPPYTILWLDNFLAELEDWRQLEIGWGVREE